MKLVKWHVTLLYSLLGMIAVLLFMDTIHIDVWVENARLEWYYPKKYKYYATNEWITEDNSSTFQSDVDTDQMFINDLIHRWSSNHYYEEKFESFIEETAQNHGFYHALHNKTILFYGDSTMRYLYYSLTNNKCQLLDYPRLLKLSQKVWDQQMNSKTDLGLHDFNLIFNHEIEKNSHRRLTKHIYASTFLMQQCQISYTNRNDRNNTNDTNDTNNVASYDFQVTLMYVWMLGSVKEVSSISNELKKYLMLTYPTHFNSSFNIDIIIFTAGLHVLHRIYNGSMVGVGHAPFTIVFNQSIDTQYNKSLSFESMLTSMVNQSVQLGTQCLIYRTTNFICDKHIFRDGFERLYQLYANTPIEQMYNQSSKLHNESINCANHFTKKFGIPFSPQICHDYAFTNNGVERLNHRMRQFVLNFRKSKLKWNDINLLLFDSYYLFFDRCRWTTSRDGRHYKDIKFVESLALIRSISRCW